MDGLRIRDAVLPVLVLAVSAWMVLALLRECGVV
jgi:hypothetical protein